MYGKGYNTVADNTHIDDKNITVGKKTQTSGKSKPAGRRKTIKL